MKDAVRKAVTAIACVSLVLLCCACEGSKEAGNKKDWTPVIGDPYEDSMLSAQDKAEAVDPEGWEETITVPGEETPEDATDAWVIPDENLPRPAAGSITEKHSDVQAQIEAIAQKHGAVGVQVAVVQNGQVVDSYTYGWATKNTDKMTADHKIRVASLSKIAVGMAAMCLQDEGTVNIDGDIGSYWDMKVRNPSYPNTPITLRMLLSHTSTLYELGDDMPVTESAIREQLSGSGFDGRKPGAVGSYYYNNYAFRVLGVTLELAGARTLDDLLGQKLFAPMGIDAAFAGGDLKNTDSIATLYRSSGAVGLSADTQRSRHNATVPGGDGIYYAGNLVASATDFAKLIALLANDGVYEGQQLLSAEAVALMESYMSTALPDGAYQALPMLYRSGLYGQSKLYYHTGSGYGVYNCASYDPTTGSGVVVLTTGADGDADLYGIYEVCSEINQYIYSLID